MTSPGGEGGTDRERDGTHILWGPPCAGHLLQVAGASSRGGGRRLVISGPQPTAC